MAAKLPVWGIDVGQCSLKAIKLQLEGDNAEMLEFDIIEHEGVLSQAGAEAGGMVRAAIEKFITKHDLKGSKVVVSVPGQQTLTRFIKMPPVEPKKIPDMVRYEAGQQIPFDMDEVVWDYQVFQETDSPDIEVGIFAIRRELIRNHLAQFTDLGVEPFIAQAGPMASYNAIKFDQAPPSGESMVLLDMGALATDLIVMTGNTIWSRPVPIGGNRFTEALVGAFKISFKKAEELKRSAASSKYARQIFQAMRPVFADLVSEIQRSIGSYTSNHREAHITRALGMGNAFKLPGLQKFLQQNLQIEFGKLSEFKKLTLGTAGQSPEFTDNIMSFSMAYGLALQGLGAGAVDSNLLPPEIRKNLLWKKKRVWFGGAAACLAGAAGAIWAANQMALGALNTGMGSVQSASLPNVAYKDADNVLNQGQGTQSPVEYLVRTAGALNAMKTEYQKQGSGSDARQALLNEVAKLPNNNLVVPRALQVIQKSFNSCMGEAYRSSNLASEYLDQILDAKGDPKTKRAERDELWIDEVKMTYNSLDATQGLPQDPSAPAPVPGKDKFPPGWGIQIVGTTTRTSPAKWLEECLISKLDVEGKRPQRGFYFDRVELKEVHERPNAIIGVSSEATNMGSVGGVTPPRGVQQPAMRDPRRDGRRGGFENPPFPGANQPSPDKRGKNVSEEVGDLRFKPTEDPLTKEKTKDDKQFVIYLVMYALDTPNDKIPEVFKPKDTKPADTGKPPAGKPPTAKPTAPKPPPEAPRRE